MYTSLSRVPGASALSPLRPFPMAGSWILYWMEVCRTNMVNEMFSLGRFLVGTETVRQRSSDMEWIRRGIFGLSFDGKTDGSLPKTN